MDTKRGHRHTVTRSKLPHALQLSDCQFFKENQPKKKLKKDSSHKASIFGRHWTEKDVALSRLTKQVALREGAHIHYRIALCDGCEALQSRIVLHFRLYSHPGLCARERISMGCRE